MRDELLLYYERELSYLRQMAVEFAGKYPKVASRLVLEPDKCEDPHVERLLDVDGPSPLAARRGGRQGAPPAGGRQPQAQRTEQSADIPAPKQAVDRERAAREPCHALQVERARACPEIGRLQPVDVAQSRAVPAGPRRTDSTAQARPALLTPLGIQEVDESGPDGDAAQKVSCAHPCKGHRAHTSGCDGPHTIGAASDAAGRCRTIQIASHPGRKAPATPTSA